MNQVIKIKFVNPNLIYQFEQETKLELWGCAGLYFAETKIDKTEDFHEFLRQINLHPAVLLAWIG
jgi:hypothetical protein